MRIEQLHILQALVAAPLGTMTAGELVKALGKAPHALRCSAAKLTEARRIATDTFNGYRNQKNLRYTITPAGRAAIVDELKRREPKPKAPPRPRHDWYADSPAVTRHFGNSVFDWRGDHA